MREDHCTLRSAADLFLLYVMARVHEHWYKLFQSGLPFNNSYPVILVIAGMSRIIVKNIRSY